MNHVTRAECNRKVFLAFSGDLLKPIHYYALESICAITLDARMGCLKDKPNDDRVLEVMRAIETVVASFF